MDKPTPSTLARLACGCRLAFRTGVEGSPVTVVIQEKAVQCRIAIHVGGMPIYDHREALRPATRPLPATQPDFGDES